MVKPVCFQPAKVVLYDDVVCAQTTLGLALPESVLHYIQVVVERQLYNAQFDSGCVGERYLAILSSDCDSQEVVSQLAEYTLVMMGFFPEKSFEIGGGSFDFMLHICRHAYAQNMLLSCQAHDDNRELYGHVGRDLIAILDILWVLRYPAHRTHDWPQPMQQAWRMLASRYTYHLQRP